MREAESPPCTTPCEGAKPSNRSLGKSEMASTYPGPSPASNSWGRRQLCSKSNPWSRTGFHTEVRTPQKPRGCGEPCRRRAWVCSTGRTSQSHHGSPRLIETSAAAGKEASGSRQPRQAAAASAARCLRPCTPQLTLELP